MEKCEKLVDAGRRQFLSGGAAAAAIGVAATVVRSDGTMSRATTFSLARALCRSYLGRSR